MPPQILDIDDALIYGNQSFFQVLNKLHEQKKI